MSNTPNGQWLTIDNAKKNGSMELVQLGDGRVSNARWISQAAAFEEYGFWNDGSASKSPQWWDVEGKDLSGDNEPVMVFVVNKDAII